jgi:hypothetical protein
VLHCMTDTFLIVRSFNRIIPRKVSVVLLF